MGMLFKISSLIDITRTHTISATVSFGMIRLYAVIASNQIKNK